MEWLPEKHLAYFILDVVGELDLGQIEEAIQQKDARGERPYAPGMMTALLFYGYCVGSTPRDGLHGRPLRMWPFG
jgi:hypothetical protein